MPQVLQERPRSLALTNAESSSPERGATSVLQPHADSGHGYPSMPADEAAVSKLNTLLEADPVNLAEVGDAIRAYPALESLILQLCESLALTFGVPVCSAEEAAIVLGKDRLRILVRAWPTMQLRERAEGRNCAGDGSGARNDWRSSDAGSARRVRPQTPEITPEVLYLANFLRCVGADPAATHVAPEPTAGLTSKLARDLLFLMPFVETMTLTPEQRVALQEMLQFWR